MIAAKTRRDSQRQLLRRFSADPQNGGLRGEQSLRHEFLRSAAHGVRRHGVTVTALCPGPVHTEFSDVASGAPEERQKTAAGITHVPVEEVVRDGLAGVEAQRPIVIPGLVMKVAMMLVRLTPMPILRRSAKSLQIKCGAQRARFSESI